MAEDDSGCFNSCQGNATEMSVHSGSVSGEHKKIVPRKSSICDLRKYSDEQVKLMKPSNNLKNAFRNMKISDAAFLNELDGRTNCSKCGKSRKYFCYTCCIALPSIADRIPRLQLPCKIDVVKHPREIDGKSTAVHAAVIAPDDVRIFTYPDLPDYTKEENVVLIFPTKEAVPLKNLWPHLSQLEINNDSEPEHKRVRQQTAISRAVFIDCTWNQTKKLYNDERLKGLKCVELTERETLFWRYQRGKPNTYLATIEAIYYFVVDVHTHLLKQKYASEYDDLLFFFKFMFEKIHSLYDTNTLRAYKEI